MVPAVATRLWSRPLRRKVVENVLIGTKVRKVDTTQSSFADVRESGHREMKGRWGTQIV